MSERREPGFNLDPINDTVPTLDPPANKGDVTPAHNPAVKTGSSSRVLLILLVFVAVGLSIGLGLWTVQLKERLEEQQVLIEQMNLWLESTDATLTQTSTSASRSGETLMGRVETMNQRLDERVKHFDSEIAKLWTIAYQRNKPQLEEQGKTLTAHTEQLNVQQASLAETAALLDVLRTEIDSQVQQLSELNAARAQTESAVAQNNSRLEGQLTQVNALETETGRLASEIDRIEQKAVQIGSDMEFQLSVERDERAKLAAEMKAKLDGAAGAATEQRLRTIEERLKAIDAARATLNAELLKVQGQVNGLMLDQTVR